MPPKLPRLTLLLHWAVVIMSAIVPPSGTKADGHEASAPPNVLFIAIDDLNACLDRMDGELPIPTPHLDQLARRGTLFTNAHCAAPACSPSRVAVMTGLAPSTSGVYYNQQDWRKSKVFQEVTTLPQHFHNHGYTTMGGGKIYHAASLSEWGHEGYLDPRPWDEFYPSKSQQLPREVVPDKIPTNGNPQHYHGYMDWATLDIEPEEMGDAKVVAWAEQHLSRTHENPLFLAVGIYRPHIPWYTPKQYFDQHPLDEITLPEIYPNDLDDVPVAGQNMSRRSWHEWISENDKWHEAIQGYKASVSFADDMVGRLIAALDAGPLADNTVVVLWTDHGYHLGQKETWEKFALWEQTTRVPLIIAAPGQFKVGRTSAQAVSLLDIFPTLSELCGLPFKDRLDGENLIPLLENPDLTTDRSVVITHGRQNHAVRSDRWRYTRYADGSEELYDQRSDPKNFHNLATKPAYAAVKRDLINRLPAADALLDPERK